MTNAKPPTSPPGKTRRARLTVTEALYHQPPEDNPAGFGTPFSRDLTTDEQVYGPRKVTVGEDWKKVDTGWLGSDVGMLLIEMAEVRFEKNPTAEEKRLEAGKRVLIGLSVGAQPAVPFALLRPGESARFEPFFYPDSCLCVISVKGSVQVTFTAFPK